MNKRKSIRRGEVYVTLNKQGGIYTIYDDTIMINVEQVIIWSDEGVVWRHIAKAVYSGSMDMLDIEFMKGSILSGQIITVQQTEPVDIDNPLEYLLGDGHIRTPEGQYLWQYSYYQPDMKFHPTDEVDELILAPY